MVQMNSFAILYNSFQGYETIYREIIDVGIVHEILGLFPIFSLNPHSVHFGLLPSINLQPVVH